MKSSIQRLFPNSKAALTVDDLYTVPELNFPTGGVSLSDERKRPYVYFNMVSSVDGRAVTAGGNAAGLGSDTDHRLMHRLRLASDAVMIGAATFRRDPFVPSFSAELASERARYFPTSPDPWGVVVSRDGNLPLDKEFFRTGKGRRIVALGQQADPEREVTFKPYAKVVRVPSDQNGQLDISWLLAYLFEEIGVGGLLCEGGPSLNYSLLSKGLGDELFWTLAPKLVAGKDNSTIITGSGTGFSSSEMPRLELVSLYEQANELFFRYKVKSFA